MKLSFLILSLGLSLLNSQADQTNTPSSPPLTTAQTTEGRVNSTTYPPTNTVKNQPFFISHSYKSPPMFWGQAHWVRETLEQLPDIQISKNTLLGEVEYLIHSNSKTTTAEVIKALQKKMLPLAPVTIQQTIIPIPKYKYLITLKKNTAVDIANTYIQSFIRQHIKTNLTCDYLFFKDATIEIWSNKEIDLATLKNDKLLTLPKSTPYGGGIKSAISLQ